MDTLINLLATTWHDIVTTLHRTLASNELAQGGLLLGALGALAATLRTFPGRLWEAFKNRFTLTLDVQGDDHAFPWLAAWLAAQPVGRHLRHLGVVTRFNEHMGGQNLTLGTDRDGDAVHVRLVPLGGQVLLRYRGHWVLARPSRERRDGQDRKFLGYTHALTFRMFASARNVIPQLLQDAYDFTAGRHDGRVEIHVPEYQGWNLAERRAARPLSSLVYDGDVLQRARGDLAAFLADRAWYAEVGIPYRRGYLLHGPPGNGKSSLVAALAGEFGLGVCILNLATPELSDDRLVALLSNLPRRAVILLEDIDAVFHGRAPRTPSVKLSFNGLLNALDGVAAGEDGRVTFMTTNHLEHLDAALIRPGRADVHVFLGNASRAQVAGMLRRFWPDVTEGVVRELAHRVPDGAVSMAAVQEFLLARRGDFDAVQRDWNAWLVSVHKGCPTKLRLLSA
ncbi:AAA family ATPase [Deinococcus yavapaiensis]|nr:AAA family ATPase [Deinococcus yavapaiensis]